jgi:hypothetical protein
MAIPIHAQISREHLVFDKSGRLPFSIIFGLFRHSKEDVDPRQLAIDVRRSMLDVPYALSAGLLTLWNDTDNVPVNLEPFNDGQEFGDDAPIQLILPSPVGRSATPRRPFTIYHYLVRPESDLGSLLQPGKRYSMRIASHDLSIRRCTWMDSNDPGDGSQNPSVAAQQMPQLIARKRYGRALFTVVDSLPWPPHVQLTMKPVSNEADKDGNASHIELTFTNTGDHPISIQHKGRQVFLQRWGVLGPEDATHEGALVRAISPNEKGILSNLAVTDLTSGDIVRAAAKPASCILYASNADHRPMLESMVTLQPGRPLVRRVDVASKLAGLPDGRYSISLHARDTWWFQGTVEDAVDEGDKRVARRLYCSKVPPVRLQCEQAIEVQLRDGGMLPEIEQTCST